MVKRMNIKQQSQHPKGFTIIELLIVVVVIGILATLVITTFAGAQRKARNVKTLSNVKQYYNMIEAYSTLHGYYPASPTEGTDNIAMVCLGLGYANGSCGTITGTQVFESEDFMEELSTALGTGGSQQSVNSVDGAVGNENFVGAAYGIDITGVYGGSRGRTIQWFLEGENQDCTISRSYAYNTESGNTACEIPIEPYPLP